MEKESRLSVFGLSIEEFKRKDRKTRQFLIIGRSKEELQKLCKNFGVRTDGHRIELQNRLVNL